MKTYRSDIHASLFFLKKKIGFIALKFTNVYMKVYIKTVPDTSLHETSDLT